MLKVIGVGDNVVDKYRNKGVMYPGGNALNFSVYAKMLGMDSSYLGIFGTDFAGRYVRKTVAAMGISIPNCRDIEGENGFACVDIINGDRKFVGTNHGGVSRTSPLELDESDYEYLKQFNLIHTSINSFGYQKFVKEMGKREMVVSFDFSGRFNDDLLAELGPYASYAILSCGHLEVDDTLSVMQKTLAYGFQGVVGTRGMEGAYYMKKGCTFFQEAESEPAIDALGAGDSFLTAFLLGYLDSSRDDQAIRKAMKDASHFATGICMVHGAFDHATKIQ